MTEGLPTAATTELVGREAERARIDRFIASISAGPSALSIGGGPGVGKTALWRFAISDARARGHRVLISRPAEEEMPLSGVGLTDLFEGYRLAGLTVGTDDPFSTGRAVLGALRDMADDGSTLLAIDDVQWLDSFSARSLRYALRRLETEPIAVVTTLRHDAAHGDPLALASTLPPERQDVVEPGPLQLDDIRRLIGDSGGAISRPTLRRIAEVSAGNPLYALELARALRAKGTDTPAGSLPLPDSVQLAIGDRVGSHAGDVGTLLEIVSAMGRSSVGALREISLTNDLDKALGVAQEERLLVVEEDLTVRFSHPMVGSVVYARIDPIAKRALHARLAALASEPDVRARHVALSTESADAGAAALLEDAAARANHRGASDLAADFIAHSLRLTPAHDEGSARRRRLQQIAYLAASGEAGRALALADELLASLPHGPARAEVLVQRFEVEDDDLAFGERLLEEALDDAGEDEALRGRVLDMLAWLRGMLRGNLQDGIRCARAGLEIAERTADARLRMLTQSSLAVMEALVGHPRPDLLNETVDLELALGAQGTSEAPRALSGKLRFWAGDLPGARERFDEALETAAREGMELTRPYRLYDLSLLECAAGNLVEARELARLGIEAAEDAHFPPGWLHYPSALVSAWLGHATDARRSADLLLDWARPRGERTAVVRALMVQGLVALSEGDAADACPPLPRLSHSSKRSASLSRERSPSFRTRSRPSRARAISIGRQRCSRDSTRRPSVWTTPGRWPRPTGVGARSSSRAGRPKTRSPRSLPRRKPSTRSVSALTQLVPSCCGGMHSCEAVTARLPRTPWLTPASGSRRWARDRGRIGRSRSSSDPPQAGRAGS